MDEQSLGLTELTRGYTERRFRPADVVSEIYRRIGAAADLGAWITLVSREHALDQAHVLAGASPASLPLYGIPFAIKDNVDLAGIPTTAACPAFAYTPGESAHVVTRLIEAGAIPIGKTNLDQFATGLVGTRSPYGVCRNSFDPAYIAGGSSSGSAVVVATGLVSFALGTDTAGSGRIPAAFNNLVGLKPTCGRLSPRGMVPACRTLDSLSIFALTAEDAARVCRVAEGFDPLEPYSRHPARARGRGCGPLRFGVPRPEQLQFFGHQDYPRLFDAAAARLAGLGAQRVLIDFTPFAETARLLYEGPWLAERFIAVEELLTRSPEALHPITRQVIEPGARPTAAAAFRAQYRLQALRRAADEVFDDIDLLVTPTAPTHYRIDEVEANPITLNTRLGYYTNFMNLLDLAAVAVPAGFDSADRPFGVTLAAPAWSDYMLLEWAAKLQRGGEAQAGALRRPLDADRYDWIATGDCIAVAVCGAHLNGLPLNHQLVERGATLLESTLTAPVYRFFALPGGPPARPGLVRVENGGGAVEVEIWAVPSARFGSFVAAIPAPLVMGKVQLSDGRQICGFLCEAQAVSNARDITALGGWRAYLASGT